MPAKRESKPAALDASRYNTVRTKREGVDGVCETGNLAVDARARAREGLLCADALGEAFLQTVEFRWRKLLDTFGTLLYGSSIVGIRKGAKGLRYFDEAAEERTKVGCNARRSVSSVCSRRSTQHTWCLF